MFRLHLTCLALGSACCCLGVPAGARATPPARAASSSPTECAPRARFHADLELDPVAYALDGFSLHVGLGYDVLRLDLGVFGLRVPELIHQQPDFEVRFDGYGLKLQYFPFAEQRGLFVGIDSAYSRSLVRLEGSQSSARDNQLAIGVNVGFRIDVVAGFYVTPWLGVGHAFGADDVTLENKRFSSNSLIIFPALHLGFRLR